MLTTIESWCLTMTVSINRLIKEKSPYLLQHAYNPVDWYPWCDEAFERAEAEDKPVFLSIGYSTCHWCHVMERESFEDEKVGELLNRNFISIKVDREERPDVDHLCMQACISLTGSGGWPLSIFMDAEKKPFFAGTYFPKNNFINILEHIQNLWENDRQVIHNAAQEIVQALEEREVKYKDIRPEIVTQTFNQLNKNFDRRWGGFGTMPKFPTVQNYLFLLRYYYSTGDDTALEVVNKSLEAMARGGIYDHIGYGFCRYSTDAQWLEPHFEKMLYDNALLSMTYTEAYAVTKKPFFKEVAEDVYSFILRDMTSPEGGFYAGCDADSEGVEGKFYIWSADEVRAVLGEEKANAFCRMYDITKQGNFKGKNIPNCIERGILTSEKASARESIKLLFEARQKRVHPFKDDKILLSWNGLAIASFAIGARILKNQEYIDAAEKCVQFILTHMEEDGKLFARYRDGEVLPLGFADDYAYFIWGLTEVYETTTSVHYLEKALSLTEYVLAHFWDEKNGGIFITPNDGEKLIVRPKETSDGAIPCANSVFIYHLIRLARLTGRQHYEEKARQALKALTEDMERVPMAYTFSALCVWLLVSQTREVVLAAPNKINAEEMIDHLHQNWNPLTTWALYTPQNESITKIMPYVKEMKPAEGQPTAYICENFSCHPPITDIEDFKKAIH